MLEHSAMYLNVTPPYEEDTTFFPDFFSTRLGPCELQDPVWAKMSALASGVGKKRKKSEAKPQAQINKCNNEKRRREQENIYIEELAELISANFADMSSLSVKPDKCAILQEAVNQIRSIKQQETAAPSDPVQQGEVSSSRPTILSNEIYGPLLLEALEGFLFVINSEGKVEHVTENVSTYIKYTREDVLGKSIYNFIHHGDHAKFHTNLLPMTFDWGSDQQNVNRSKSLDIRLLVKPPEDLDESVEEKQQRITRYELMHISSTQLRDQLSVSEEDGSDSGPCLLCVASRISQRDKAHCSIEQFTTKLDTTGKVICVDTSGVADVIAQYLKNELKNRNLRELVHQQELNKINGHLRETLTAGQSTSAIYRLQIGQDKSIQVQTKSKLFKTNLSNDTDFIMSTHSILGDNDTGGPTDPGGGTSSSGSNTGVGGPLMTSVVNGTRNGPPVCSGNDTSTALLNANPTFSTFALDNEFNFDIFPSSTWELESSGWQETRPESRHSVTPVSTPTPRPPSNPSYSNAPTSVQSSPFATQPSPSRTNPPTPSYNNFSFSPMNDQGYAMEEQKDTKANVMEEASVMSESIKLRNLLTKPQNNNNTENDDKNKDRILKKLLNQRDEDGGRNDNRGSPRGMQSRPMAGPSEPPKTSSSSSDTGNNNMLRQLLNDKSDDDDIESRAGMKKKSELLHELLKPERDSEDDKRSELSCNDDTLMRSLGFPCSPNNERGRKRSLEQGTKGGLPISTTLRDSNKMLASLLSNMPSNHQPIPPIPESIISAIPQEKLPRITDPNKAITLAMNQNTVNTRTNMNRMSSRQQQQQQAVYANTIHTSNNVQQRNNHQQMNQANSSSFHTTAVSSAENSINYENNDPFLSDLLDQVIEFVPDAPNPMDNPNNLQMGNYQCSEAVAINNIQQSLMQCENVVTSPASPIQMPVNNPPVYPSSSMPNNAFPLPPPNYPQAKYQRMQMRAQQQFNTNSHGNAMLLKKQQEQKRRLLSQQKQQQLLIPSNAAANEMNSMQNIDNLVAPNVTLQRSSTVGEPQLSPSYGGQSQRVGGQQPYSPHAQMTSPLGQQTYPQTTTANYQNMNPRLSPQLQFGSQLSPRQAYTQGNAQNTNWQQPQVRMNVQQNPMLNAQLARPPQQPQRTMSSPGTVSARQTPYSNDQFAAPTSPNDAFSNQYMRAQQQRTNSVSNVTAQISGGLGSPRPYTGREHHPHPYSPIPPHHNVPPMMYQESQYLYDQTGMSLAYNGADRGRAPPHLQTGVSASGPTSEFVRQELRAVVGARTAQAQPTTSRAPSQMMVSQQQVSDLESLGINFELPSGASDSPKLWGAMVGSDMGSMSPQPTTSRTTMEEGRQGDQKSSLLQKLLSE